MADMPEWAKKGRERWIERHCGDGKKVMLPDNMRPPKKDGDPWVLTEAPNETPSVTVNLNASAFDEAINVASKKLADMDAKFVSEVIDSVKVKHGSAPRAYKPAKKEPIQIYANANDGTTQWWSSNVPKSAKIPEAFEDVKITIKGSWDIPIDTKPLGPGMSVAPASVAPILAPASRVSDDALRPLETRPPGKRRVVLDE